MKTGSTEQVIRTTYLLEMGLDFQASDLEDSFDGLKVLSKEYRENFCKLNIGKLTWSDYFDKQTKTILIKTEKELFV